MNHHVPDFELDDVYSVPDSSGLTRKSSMADDEVMELLWQNGHLVTQTQNQRSGRRNSDRVEAGPPPTASTEIRSAVEEVAVHQDHLFMQEDEMVSWLHCPFQETTFERDIGDFFNPPPPMATASNPNISVSSPPPMAEVSEEVKVSTSMELNVQPRNELASLPVVLPTPPTRPPVPPSSKQKEVVTEAPKPRRRVHNFAHFTKLRIESGQSSSGKSAKESRVVASHTTPKVSEPECGRISLHEGGGASNSARDLMTTTTMNTYDFATTSSPGGDSSASMSAGGELPRMPSGNQEERKEAAVGEARKRKGREVDDNEGHSLDDECEFGGEKKQARGSTSTKRSRAAEVHNLSERRRRDRINEKMKTLQELIPRCNKTDKASMLDEAIEYLKSLQLQVQMMSMGCGMVPMMYPGVHQYPGVQQYMPPMGMGMPMGMDMSMNRPLVPYHQMVQGSSMHNPAAGAHMAPRFPMQAFHMPVVHDPSRMQPPNAGDPMINPMAAHNANFPNPYQQYLGPQQNQVSIPQNQTTAQQTNAKPSSSKEDENPENHQPGK